MQTEAKWHRESQRQTDPGKGPLLLGLAVGLGLQLGYNSPALSQGFFCCCNPLPLPHLGIVRCLRLMQRRTPPPLLVSPQLVLVCLCKHCKELPTGFQPCP